MRRIVLLACAVAAMTVVQSYAVRSQELVDGLVTKIDESEGKMTIRHGPIKKFDMDHGMTMVFRVADPAMLKAVKPGDKVKFDADKVYGRFTVTKIEKAK